MTEGVSFRILGPLRAGVRGTPVDLGGDRARLVLAALLLEPDRPVPVDRLVDVVWRDRPPASARTQIAIAVSGLRRAFRGAGCADHVIETVRPGYRVPAQAGAIDALAAEELIGGAREAVAAGRPAEAAELFQDALRLWDGPVLAGLDRPGIEASALRWEELRLTALEEAAQVELALGRHRELVGELMGPVGEHPFRERLRVLLMIALARAGRQSEALDVYHEGRRSLDEELGLEPGRELQEVHAAVLRDDPVTRPQACAGPRGRALRWRRTSGPARGVRTC
ncbi:AfsR/SARP family transcriptional regulator [Actinomadura madurae]|uniref:AfsR/SARP family transcriptional regulator n=1 Tax=Actinomadura madurae TaxID=1993 RepID=UPI00202659FD|nr:AfsR/SARP family transcriptional regulator [Actinomadura madurae]URN00178.1 AfsR/SARP family transcriptional regulator [Actinomadura madurae]